MLHAASHGHIMSDNALSNVGKWLDDIVIIDAGSRTRMRPLAKSEFNKTCMRKLWSKVQVVVHKKELARCESAWQQTCDMQSAQNAFDLLWNSIDLSIKRARSNAERPALKHDAEQDQCVSTAQLGPLPESLDSGACDNENVEQPAPTRNTACPNAAALLECVSSESLD